MATFGDNAYEDGRRGEFRRCYDPHWGRHRERTRPAVGNHEYGTKDARPYFEYFGARAGRTRGEGWAFYRSARRRAQRGPNGRRPCDHVAMH